MTELTQRRAKLADYERQTWQRHEAARGSGASAAELGALREDAGQLHDQKRALDKAIYDNTLLRDGRYPWAREFDRDR